MSRLSKVDLVVVSEEGAASNESEDAHGPQGMDADDEEEDDPASAQLAALERSALVKKISSATMELIARIEGVQPRGAIYFFEPLLVAENIRAKQLEDVDSVMFGYKVKWQLCQGKLFITDLSTAARHSGAVHEIVNQASNWASGFSRRFAVLSDAVIEGGQKVKASAPDCVVAVSRTRFRIVENMKLGKRSPFAFHI